MTYYQISVTDLSRAQQALTKEGITSKIQGMYVEIFYETGQKLALIRLLNKARIVVYDIEEM